MKSILVAIILLIVALGLSACTEGFPDEEMHFGIDDKVRPYAVVIKYAEAAPGQQVIVKLYLRTPDPDELDITWQVALDYDLGMYETEEVERNIRSLGSPMPSVDSDGFLCQTFRWVVPDSTLLYSSALPEVLDDPVMVALAEELIGPEAGSPPTKSAVDAWLKAMTLYEMRNFTEEEKEAVWALADRFACQVRFRTTLSTGGAVIDVTKNLTIRHTERLGGPNTNNNIRIFSHEVVALDKVDAVEADLDDPTVSRTSYPIIEGGITVANRLQVPFNGQKTYFMRVIKYRALYSSPYDPDLFMDESWTTAWYYFRQDNPVSGHNFFVQDDGSEAELSDLNANVRIMPDGVGSTFRVVMVARDFRFNWVAYHATPGAFVSDSVVEFVAE